MGKTSSVFPINPKDHSASLTSFSGGEFSHFTLGLAE